MTPDLSRRVARALHRLDVDELPPARRFEVGSAAEPADSFADLPGWVQALVLSAEGKAAP